MFQSLFKRSETRRPDGVRPLTAEQAMCIKLPTQPQRARLRLEHQQQKGWRPRPDRPPVPFTLPFDWTADPFRDANWRFQLSAWRPLDVYIGSHCRGGDLQAYRFLIDAMLDWARAEHRGRGKAAFWGDMAAGIRAAKLAYVISQPAFEAQSRLRRDAVIRLARRHLARLRDPAFIAYSNHALAQIHGAAALCHVAPDWPEAQDGRAYVSGLLSRLLLTQFGRRGVHLEHSPGYHFFALREFRRMAETGWFDNPDLARTIRGAAKAVPWFIFPDGTSSAAGDSSPVRRPFPAPVVEERVVGRLFREAGYAVVRTRWDRAPTRAAMLLVTCGHHSNVHKHADDLSFELFERGHRLLVDTGKYSYSAGAMRDYSLSARAHNTIDLVSERDDNGLGATAPSGGGLTAMTHTRWGWFIAGRIDRPAFGVAHQRRFLYRPGQWLILLDRVTADTPRLLTAWLHLHPRIVVQAAPDGWTRKDFRIRHVADHPLTLRRVRGEDSPPQGWMAADYHHRVENDALAAGWLGRGGRLATIISLGGHAPPEVRLTEDDFEVVWRGAPLAIPRE
ncbi:alginate lyase family protein [Brevundimonas sp.]|uniref:heparinase II/III family protein n=1 Tax=Brevundimonas sp. TaxID=1871086 RepID=UPI00391DA084